MGTGDKTSQPWPMVLSGLLSQRPPDRLLEGRPLYVTSLRTPLSRGVPHSFFEQAESKARVTLPPTANNWEGYLHPLQTAGACCQNTTSALLCPLRLVSYTPVFFFFFPPVLP